jgi:agmatinase
MSKALGYGGLEDKYCRQSDSQIAILPIPFDMTSSWLTGSDKGPEALIRASANMELYDIETKSEVYKRGIYTAPAILAANSEEMVQKAYTEALNLIQSGKFVVALGGEHAVSNGPIRAHAEYYQNISVLQLDAHTDLRDSYKGDPLSHASIMARVKEISGVKSSVAVGIRAVDSSELPAMEQSNIIFAEEVDSSSKWMSKAIEQLTENVYITFDLDVLDPAIMPSTGTPEPGGMWWYQTLEFLRLVSRERKIIGFDVVELLPSEHNQAPDFLAAKLVYKLLSYVFIN